MSTWQVENKWPCNECGSINIGRYTSCQQCGSAKDASEAAKESIDTTAVVTDPWLFKQAQEAAHWICEHCNGKQRDVHGNCVNCGGARLTEILKHGEERSAEAAKTARQQPNYTVDPKSGVIKEKTARKGLHTLIIPTIVTAAILMITGLYFLFRTQEFTAVTTETKWIHIGQYEERLTKNGEGWGAPGGAFNTKCERKYYGTEKCNPYQQSYSCNGRSCNCRNSCTSNGNGFSTCRTVCSTCYSTCYRTVYDTCYSQCPVYKDWCTYNYHQWVGRGSRTLTGDDPSTMEWPDLGRIDDTHRLVKTPAYIVHFVDQEDAENKFSYAPDTADNFSRFHKNQEWTCEKAIIGRFKPMRLK